MPSNIILKNQSVDPRLQNQLYIKLKNIESNSLPIPLHPSNFYFYDNLKNILGIIDECFVRDYGLLTNYLALLCSYWANEKTIAEIINEDIAYKKRTSSGLNVDKKYINKRIEDILKNINDKLKFEICRDISCYVDVLNQVLEDRQMTPVAMDLGYYLEVGACKKTTLTLLNNGVPRTTAILISRRMNPNIQDFVQCKQFIIEHRNELEKDIPSILFSDII